MYYITLKVKKYPQPNMLKSKADSFYTRLYPKVSSVVRSQSIHFKWSKCSFVFLRILFELRPLRWFLSAHAQRKRPSASHHSTPHPPNPQGFVEKQSSGGMMTFSDIVLLKTSRSKKKKIVCH